MITLVETFGPFTDEELRKAFTDAGHEFSELIFIHQPRIPGTTYPSPTAELKQGRVIRITCKLQMQDKLTLKTKLEGPETAVVFTPAA